MTGHTERRDGVDVERENRQLRAALQELLSQFEDVPDVDCERVRDRMPDSPGEKNPIRPPWERKGYESKEVWLADKKDGE